MKAIFRKAAARTLEELWAAIRTARTAFTPDECANYFAPAAITRLRSKMLQIEAAIAGAFTQQSAEIFTSALTSDQKVARVAESPRNPTWSWLQPDQNVRPGAVLCWELGDSGDSGNFLVGPGLKNRNFLALPGESDSKEAIDVPRRLKDVA